MSRPEEDTSPSRVATGHLLELAFLGGALLLAFHHASLRHALTSWPALASPYDLAHGLARTPFQYRLLIPALARGLDEVAWSLGVYLSPRQAFAAIEVAAAFGTLYALRAYLASVTASRHLGAAFALIAWPVIAYAHLLPRQQALFFPWDTPGVLLFALGLTLLHRRRWWPYLALFVVATLNRETSCFLTVVYALTAHEHTPRRHFIGRCALQFCLWLGIKVALLFAFQDNVGAGLFELRHQTASSSSHLASNLAYLSTWRAWPALASTCAGWWLIVVLWRRHIADAFVARSLWMLPPFFAGMMVVANIYEARIFAELTPVFAGAVAAIVVSLVRASVTRPESKTQG